MENFDFCIGVNVLFGKLICTKANSCVSMDAVGCWCG